MYIFILGLFLFCPFQSYAKAARTYILHSPEYGGGAGLFHNFHIIVGLLDFYEKNTSIGLVVDFEDKGLYYEAAYGPNWWNYYFEPICLPALSVQKRKPIKKIVEIGEKIYFGNSTLWYFSRDSASRLIRKYIKLKRDIENEIQCYITHHFEGCYVIGVHYRNTDKQTEAPHVPLSTLCVAIQNQIEQASGKKIKVFLATDDIEAKEYLVNKFKDDLIFQNIFYSSGLIGAHFVHRGYESGKRAVIDGFLLSKCDVLIRTSSNLSAASAFINPDLPVINLSCIFTHLINNIKLNKLNDLNKVTVQ